MNVLVYSGPGTTVESVQYCTDTLRRLLTPHYSVLPVSQNVINNEPWERSTSLIVMPGGADLPYCRELNGKGTTNIKKFVQKGGRYLGFCAGAYYGSAKVEFEVGDPVLEVSGSRELGFFEGIARGSAYKGFQYGNDDGACAPKIKVNQEALGVDFSTFNSYFNGGPTFVDAAKKDGVEVLAEYADAIDVEGGPAAAVYCKYGRGSAVLTGFHPEYSVPGLKITLDKSDKRLEVIGDLEAHETARVEFVRAVLAKMGMIVNRNDELPPVLTRLSLSALEPERLAPLIESLKPELSQDKPNQLKGFNDTFQFNDAKDGLFSHLDGLSVEDRPMFTNPEDNHKVLKQVDVFYSGRPSPKDTPHFNHEMYFDELKRVGGQFGSSFGDTLLYGEVVTSTSTMLEKNFQLLKHLPTGFFAVGTIQVNGRGRGNNVWVNPPGVLAVSGVIKFPLHDIGPNTPLVFIQYLVSLAMVEAIRGYGPGYDQMPIRMKWPNDIYAENPAKRGVDVGQIATSDEYLKIGGILVNSTLLENEFNLVFGLGVNVSNAAPTTSVNLILKALNHERQAKGLPKLPEYRIEILLARFANEIGKMMRTFRFAGFRPFENLYYSRWLHTDKIVTLEQHGNMKAKIKGITMDGGMLLVEEVDRNGKSLGRTVELQPDGNSFDMFRGLLKKKT
ncbi:biotin--protein ligase [Trichomonascus vanleenenianus]|uniref:biotin--[acetyl-CoA-carboxylase] ligase BPL1 n=1 Tax=Trichomonascus vanleenenianus TaxID=2268995 RepID=UPI003EC9FAB2